jgi:hypothetical protein
MLAPSSRIKTTITHGQRARRFGETLVFGATGGLAAGLLVGWSGI